MMEIIIHFSTVPCKSASEVQDKDGIKYDVPDYNIDAQSYFLTGNSIQLDSI